MAEKGSASLAYFGLATQGVGTLLSAKSDIDAFNNMIAETRYTARYQAALERKKGAMVVSAQRAAFSKAGVELRGTPAEVMAETLNIAENNALEVERAARAKERQYSQAAKDRETQQTLQIAGIALGALL